MIKGFSMVINNQSLPGWNFRQPTSSVRRECHQARAQLGLLNLATQLLFSSARMFSQRSTKADHSGDGTFGSLGARWTALSRRLAVTRYDRIV